MSSASLVLLIAVAQGEAAGGGSGVSAAYTLYGRGLRANTASRFVLPRGPESTRATVHELRLRASSAGLTLQGTSRLVVHDVDGVRARLVADEVYYDGALGPVDFTLGKKILAWGVGHAFRPLDVIQRENRRRFGPDSIEGVPLAALEHFGDGWTLAAVYFNGAELGLDGLRLGAHQAALRGFRWRDGLDLHAVLHASADGRRGLGVGASAVLGDALEVHGSAAYANRCRRLVNGLVQAGALLADADPFHWRPVRPCIEAGAGVSFTASAGFTALFEAWHDPAGYPQREWRDLLRLVDGQRALRGQADVPAAAVEQNLAAEARFFTQRTLRRDHVLARLSYTDEEVDVALDAVITPEDGGLVATASLQYELEGWLELLGAVRGFSGRARSAFAEAPWSLDLYVGCRVAYAP